MAAPLLPTRLDQRLALPVLVGMALLVVLIAWQAGHLTRRAYIAEASGQLDVDAGLRAALIQAEIDRFHLLPMALAEDRDIAAALAGAQDATPRLDQRLETLAQETGAADLYLLRGDGTAIAASNFRKPTSFVGHSFAFRDYYRDALRKGSSMQFGLGTTSHRPGLYFARRTVGNGFIVVKREFLGIEAEWAGAPGLTLVTDADGVVVVASAPDLRFRTMQRLDPAREARVRAALRADRGPLQPLGVTPTGEGPLVRIDTLGEGQWIHAMAPAGVSGWHVHRFVPVGEHIANAQRMAWALGALAGVVVLAALAGLWLRRHRQQLRTAELKAEVDVRTAELRREIAERTEVEQRADLLREELRQANRLATLGQVTAGIAHETAQPVAAIRSYADNGIAFLERGNIATARANFTAISGLTERVGAITAQLRNFSRRREDQVRAMPLSEAVEGALLILRPRLGGIACDIALGEDPLVMASRLRLEQVLVNLLHNAIDALSSRPDARIELVATQEGGRVRLRIRDNGPGISPEIAGRLFTPFATSRTHGLGLGLVIAQDIMREMDGEIVAVDSAEGAVFDVLLKAAE
ncbi:ATP-binding protein [Novosphingobium nitrogenifigens]|nr:ATP-binding protein [Novosphingobium nitrogenifigens]